MQRLCGRASAGSHQARQPVRRARRTPRGQPPIPAPGPRGPPPSHRGQHRKPPPRWRQASRTSPAACLHHRVEACRKPKPPRGSQRSGSNGASSGGASPLITVCAISCPVMGPSAMPHMPCPPATNTRGAAVGPTSGRPSGVHGRDPTHSSRRSSRSTPARNGRTASTTAAIRRGSRASPGRRNSIIPATRSRSPKGVQATRCRGK